VDVLLRVTALIIPCVKGNNVNSEDGATRSKAYAVYRNCGFRF
jgi:hypothetical protein